MTRPDSAGRSFPYDIDGAPFEGWIVVPPAIGPAVRRPCVVLTHAWDGLNEPMRQKAAEVAALGYIAVCLDLYGRGVRGDPVGDNTRFMAPLLDDRGLLRRRLLAGIDAVRGHPAVDPDRLAVVGWCFGGLCALDAARAAAPGLRGAVSIHGVLTPPALGPQGRIDAAVLLLHGWEDPVAPPRDVLAIARELTDARADWQLQAFGHAMHAYTFPAADRPEAGLQYCPLAAARTEGALRRFLAEVLEDQPPGGVVSSSSPPAPSPQRAASV